MELEDLVLRHYKVEWTCGRMVAIENGKGKYRAQSKEIVEQVLSDNKPTHGEVEVLIGNHWYPIKRVRF